MDLYWSLTPFNLNIHCQLLITSSAAIIKKIYLRVQHYIAKKSTMECMSSGEIQASLGTTWCMVHMHWVNIFYKTIGRDWHDCKETDDNCTCICRADKIMPPFFCQHFLWCSYLPFINPTSGYVCVDNGLHSDCTRDATHLSVTVYNVSYWPSHPTAHPSSISLALAHTFSIIN